MRAINQEPEEPEFAHPVKQATGNLGSLAIKDPRRRQHLVEGKRPGLRLKRGSLRAPPGRRQITAGLTPDRGRRSPLGGGGHA